MSKRFIPRSLAWYINLFSSSSLGILALLGYFKPAVRPNLTLPSEISDTSKPVSPSLLVLITKEVHQHLPWYECCLRYLYVLGGREEALFCLPDWELESTLLGNIE